MSNAHQKKVFCVIDGAQPVAVCGSCMVFVARVSEPEIVSAGPSVFRGPEDDQRLQDRVRISDDADGGHRRSSPDYTRPP